MFKIDTCVYLMNRRFRIDYTENINYGRRWHDDRYDRAIPKRKPLWLRCFQGLMSLTILTVIAACILLAYLYTTSLPLADTDRNSRLLDSQGQVIATFSAGGKESIPVQLDHISPDLIAATLAVEDRKFYDHFGFDFKGLGRAVIVNLTRWDMSQGQHADSAACTESVFIS